MKKAACLFLPAAIEVLRRQRKLNCVKFNFGSQLLAAMAANS